MSSIKSTARWAGWIYLVMAIMNVLSFTQVFGHFVADDPAVTMRQIAGHEMSYRMAILDDFLGHVLFLILVATLFHLFADVDRRLSMLMVLFVAVPVAMQLASFADRMAPLSFLRHPEYLPAFASAQRDAVAQAVLKLHRNANQLSAPFWGLWLFPFGMLVIRSRYFPRVLGILLMLAGVGYLATGLTNLAFPDYGSQVSKVMMPLYIGEVPIVFWLAIKGARIPSR